MTHLRFDNVGFAYDDVPVLESVDFAMPPGKLTVLMGPSGCGKSTLVALAAGLLAPDSGRVIRESGRLGVVFQDPALLPWKTARDNVAFALLPAGLSRAARRARADDLLAEVGLPPEAAGMYPRQLSGGMRQRVALARALVVRPDLLFCDEPFSALDRTARTDLCGLLRDIQARAGLTTLFVTHDADEARALADAVAVMTPGRIERVGPPDTILAAPPSGPVRPAAAGRGANRR